MAHLVSRRTAIKGVTFLALLGTFEHSSYARTSSLADGIPLPTGSALATADAIHPQPGPSVIVGRAEWRMARFVECRISHHPIAGVHSTERVCPLVVADARVFPPEVQDDTALLP
jgi:hypothetical protein